MVSVRAIWYQRSPVGRLTVAIVLSLFLGQALESPALALVEACSATCPDDAADGACAPTCADCGCCSHANRNLIAPESASKPAGDAEPFIAAGAPPHLPAAFPQDVFHVPKLHLA